MTENKRLRNLLPLIEHDYSMRMNKALKDHIDIDSLLEKTKLYVTADGIAPDQKAYFEHILKTLLLIKDQDENLLNQFNNIEEFSISLARLDFQKPIDLSNISDPVCLYFSNILNCISEELEVNAIHSSEVNAIFKLLPECTAFIMNIDGGVRFLYDSKEVFGNDKRDIKRFSQMFENSGQIINEITEQGLIKNKIILLREGLSYKSVSLNAIAIASANNEIRGIAFILF